MPRYVRVNILKVTMSDVIHWLCNNGYELRETEQSLRQVGTVCILIQCFLDIKRAEKPEPSGGMNMCRLKRTISYGELSFFNS